MQIRTGDLTIESPWSYPLSHNSSSKWFSCLSSYYTLKVLLFPKSQITNTNLSWGGGGLEEYITLFWPKSTSRSIFFLSLLLNLNQRRQTKIGNADMNSTTLLIEHVWNMEENKIKGNDDNIIQILSVTVIKYHVSVDCQESYTFPRENIVPRENITILAPPTGDISTVPVDICYIRWSKGMISSKYFVLYD